MKTKRLIISMIFVVLFSIFVYISHQINFVPGQEISKNALDFLSNIIKVFPGVFILIGLFEVWIKASTIEKHFGKESGIKGYIMAIILASTTIGGLFVSFPVAYSLYHKGAKLSAIFTYISASAVCRVPMTIFEISFIGVKFTLVRFFVSLPLIVISSKLLGDHLEKHNYTLAPGK